jgi:hypothetical protein
MAADTLRLPVGAVPLRTTVITTLGSPTTVILFGTDSLTYFPNVGPECSLAPPR